MILLAILVMLFSCGMILFFRRNDVYDKAMTGFFLLILMFFTFIMSMGKNLPNFYMSPMDIHVMVDDCQKDLPPYAKCVITVSKPNITEKQP